MATHNMFWWQEILGMHCSVSLRIKVPSFFLLESKVNRRIIEPLSKFEEM